jgi:hypothetical protein
MTKNQLIISWDYGLLRCDTYGLVVKEERSASILMVYAVSMLITGCTALLLFTGYTVVLYCSFVIGKCNVFTESYLLRTFCFISFAEPR